MEPQHRLLAGLAHPAELRLVRGGDAALLPEL
jgi:hypothetical protein